MVGESEPLCAPTRLRLVRELRQASLGEAALRRWRVGREREGARRMEERRRCKTRRRVDLGQAARDSPAGQSSTSWSEAVPEQRTFRRSHCRRSNPRSRRPLEVQAAHAFSTQSRSTTLATRRVRRRLNRRLGDKDKISSRASSAKRSFSSPPPQLNSCDRLPRPFQPGAWRRRSQPQGTST